MDDSGSLLDHEEFTRWRSEADRAAESAAVQAREGLHNWACFAAEQAGQLALKGLRHGLGRGPWGHDVVRLARELARADIDVPSKVRASIRRLGRHYIPARYPDAHPSGPPFLHYESEDSDEASTDMRAVLRFVDEAWSALNE